MTRRIGIATLSTLLALGTAWAGDYGSKQKTSAEKTGTEKTATEKSMTKADKPDMASMKAEMMKCAVCKNMAANWDALAPVMATEAVKLNNGYAIVHTISDPAKVAMFHTSCKAMDTAGAEVMKMTDEQAKTSLCSVCQEVRGIMKAGGQMSTGESKNGGMMILTSADPAVQTRIASVAAMCTGTDMAKKTH